MGAEKAEKSVVLLSWDPGLILLASGKTIFIKVHAGREAVGIVHPAEPQFSTAEGKIVFPPGTLGLYF